MRERGPGARVCKTSCKIYVFSFVDVKERESVPSDAEGPGVQLCRVWKRESRGRRIPESAEEGPFEKSNGYPVDEQSEQTVHGCSRVAFPVEFMVFFRASKSGFSHSFVLSGEADASAPFGESGAGWYWEIAMICRQYPRGVAAV